MNLPVLEPGDLILASVNGYRGWVLVGTVKDGKATTIQFLEEGAAEQRTVMNPEIVNYRTFIRGDGIGSGVFENLVRAIGVHAALDMI